MTIPLSIFLIIYLVLLGVCLIFALWTIYHVVRFGTLNFRTVLTSFIFVAGIIIILFLSYQNLKEVNWQATINILGDLKIELPDLDNIKDIKL